MLECPAYSTIRDQCVHISQAAAAVAGGEDVSRAMLQLFVPSHLQELAAFLRIQGLQVEVTFLGMGPFD